MDIKILQFLLRGVLFEAIKSGVEEGKSFGGAVRIDKCRLVPTDPEDAIRLDINGNLFRVSVAVEQVDRKKEPLVCQ